MAAKIFHLPRSANSLISYEEWKGLLNLYGLGFPVFTGEFLAESRMSLGEELYEIEKIFS
jgi:hypothetical protein